MGLVRPRAALGLLPSVRSAGLSSLDVSLLDGGGVVVAAVACNMNITFAIKGAF